MHRLEQADPHHLRDPARIVAVRLVDLLRRQQRLHVPRLDADHRQPGRRQRIDQPLRQRTGLDPDPLEVVDGAQHPKSSAIRNKDAGRITHLLE